MRLLDTHVGISSFVGTRAREGHVLVTSFVNNETADWKYKQNGGEGVSSRGCRSLEQVSYLDIGILASRSPWNKSLHSVSCSFGERFIVFSSLFSLAKKADSYALSIRFENGNENIFPKWIISRKQIFYSVKLYSVLLIFMADRTCRILSLDSNEMKFSFSKRRRGDLNIRMIIIIIKSKLSKVSFQYSIRLSIIWRVTSL